MPSEFDYDTLWSLIDSIASSHRLVRFCDFADGDIAEPFCLLRHDVDYSPSAALRLAELEAERAIRATYFLMAGTRYYNLVAPEHADFARRLTTLGHEVGLHYDPTFFTRFPPSEWGALLRAQTDLLGRLSGAPVVSIAMHQPGLYGADIFETDSFGFINAYDERFVKEATYISDSCRAWRDREWSILSEGPFPSRLHLALHPINWGESDRTRESIFRTVHEELASEIRRAGLELQEKIDVHEGVVEHDRRIAKEIR